MTSPSPGGPQFGGRHRLLLRFERFSRDHYRWIFLAALVLSVIGVWLGSRLRIESDILALIPAGNAQVDAFKQAVDEFGSVSYLVVLLEAGEGQGADELEDFADALADELTGLEDLVDHVEYRLQPDDDFLELFYDNALLFLPPDELPSIVTALSDDAIRRRMAENRAALASPTGPFVEELLINDPLRLMPLFANRLMGSRGVLRVDLSGGYYLAVDGRSLILLIKPTQPWQDLEFDERLLTAARQAELDTRDLLREQGQSEIADGIQVRYSGHYAIAVDEAALIREDIRFNLSVSLGAVLILYWLCYRRTAALLYSSVPLIVGQALTFALAFLVLRSLNASSSAFTALLMGLGTDFVIVMYARYVEERRLGRTLSQATESMVGETGLGVFTGAITSAGTFYAMCISEFRGLRDLGFLIGSGILLCAIAIVFLVPAMITWNEGVRHRRVDAVRKLHVQSFLLERLIPFSARHRRPMLVAIALVTLGGGWLAWQLEFDDNVQVLRSNRSPAYQVQQRVAEIFGAAPSYMMAIAEAPTRDALLELTARIDERLAPFVASGTVGSHDSILTYLPAEAQQWQILQAVRDDPEGHFDRQRIRRTFLAALDEQSFHRAPFDPFLERMDRFLAPQGLIQLEELQRRGLGRLIDRYVQEEPGVARSVTYLHLTDPRWLRLPPPGLVEAVAADDAGIVVTGTNVVGQEFRRIFNREAPRAVLLGLVVVFILLWLDFRSLRLTAIALAQLLCGVVIMLGMMQLAGMRLNYVNAFVATMILGVGIDYGIHLVHRLSWSGGRIESGLLETGKAVVIAALTNIAAFGTLALGNYPALRSFGLAALFGSIACLFTALTLVPAVMAREPPPGAES